MWRLGIFVILVWGYIFFGFRFFEFAFVFFVCLFDVVLMVLEVFYGVLGLLAIGREDIGLGFLRFYFRYLEKGWERKMIFWRGV